MQKNLKSALLALAITGAVAVPLAGYAFAQSATAPQTQAQTQTQSATGQKEGPGGTEANTGANTEANEVKMQGSIQLPAEAQGTEGPDAQEEAGYARLARVSAEQAKQAALAAVPGTASSAKLGDEDGSLVYEVLVGNTEVLVDAGNGKVLHQEAADTEGNEIGETDD